MPKRGYCVSLKKTKGQIKLNLCDTCAKKFCVLLLSRRFIINVSVSSESKAKVITLAKEEEWLLCKSLGRGALLGH